MSVMRREILLTLLVFDGTYQSMGEEEKVLSKCLPVPAIDPAKCIGKMRRNGGAALPVETEMHCGAFRTLQFFLSPIYSRLRKYPTSRGWQRDNNSRD